MTGAGPYKEDPVRFYSLSRSNQPMKFYFVNY